ncbi:MAG: chromosomal replication initiator protein DnaA [Gemmatimonadetes bacterium]|nr:chromosomal replication initiator protein DnaA [Gemmatimonadota bacterium]
MDERSSDLWNRCLYAIQEKIQDQSFETWFAPIKARQFTSKEAILVVPERIYADWLEQNYIGLIKTTIQEVFTWNPRITFVVGDTYQQMPSAVTDAPEFVHGAPLDSVSAAASFQPDSVQPVFPLNPRYRFNNFVVGESNEVSFSAAKATAESPGQTAFNPLVLYGGVGLGKTHLLQAIGTHCIEMGTAQRVVYVTAQQFVNDYLEGINRGTIAVFHQTYRQADVLLVDDIQYYVKTEGCQREFIHTFNALFQGDKQIIISSDRPPSHLKGFEDRLISRFQWGLVTNIEAPDLPTRVAILMQKAEEMGVLLSHEIASFLAEQIDTNIRELEGALKRLIAYTKLQRYPLTIETARKTLLSPPQKTKPTITIESIQKAAAHFFEIPLDKLIGTTRKQDVATARHVSMYLSKSLTGAPLKTIGLQFGNRDHSTVIHACRRVEDKISADPEFEHLVSELQDHIVG